MSTEQLPAPEGQKPVSHNPLNDPALVRQEVPEVMDFLKENGMSILIGVGLAVAVFVGISSYRNYRQSQEVTASSQLFNSQAPEQLQQVVDQFPKTSAAPLAQLALASGYYDQGQFELAQHAFGAFLQKFPDHSQALVAELGGAQCLEALGSYEEAVAGYDKFISAHKGRYLESAAIFGKGRCLEQLGKLTEARALYEDLLLADPKGRWAGRAEYALQYVDKDIRLAAKGGVAAPVATPAPEATTTPVELSLPAATP